ncbi:hypothetical protein D3C85_774520 [compost metagenome]
MITVINEDQIAEADAWRYDDVLAVRVGAHSERVMVWRARQIATLQSSFTPTMQYVHRQLLVEVDNPNAPKILDRLRVAFMSSWANR